MKQILSILTILLLFACKSGNKEQQPTTQVETKKITPINSEIERKDDKKEKRIQTPSTTYTSNIYVYLEKDSAILRQSFGNPKGISFEVDDVRKAPNPLKIFNAKKVLEKKLEKKVLFIPEAHNNLGFAPCADNGLVQTVHECYANHRPLVLSPDVIWLAICQGVSIHINEHIDSLESTIFVENKPKTLIARNDSLEYTATSWASLIDSLSIKTTQYTKANFYTFFVPEFSTTTAITKTAYQITLLNSYKKVFQYIGESGCGIPYITILGEKQDWQEILKKLDMLDKIGLSNWAKHLKPVIQEFINIFEGTKNKDFWKAIYKDASEYNGYFVSGWIIKFFPYIKEISNTSVIDKNGIELSSEIFVPNPFYEDDNYLTSTLSTDNFPASMVTVPLTWLNLFKDEKTEMELYAGFFAIKQYDDLSLEPLISWAICKKNAPKPNHIFPYEKHPSFPHQQKYWSPRFAEKLLMPAIYDIQQFKTYRESMKHIRQVLLDSLANNPLFPVADYKNKTLQLEILSNGTVAKVKLLGSKNKALVSNLSKLVKNLPASWAPALARPADVLHLMNVPETVKKMQIRVNSKVGIRL